MILNDFRCIKCGTVGEVLVDSGTTLIDCTCGGTAQLIWLKAPGIANKSKGLYPKFSTQLGCTVESAQHENRIAKEKGLVAMGPEEYQRTMNNLNEPKEDYIDTEGFRDAAEKAWSDIQSGNVPLERHLSTAEAMAEVGDTMAVTESPMVT